MAFSKKLISNNRVSVIIPCYNQAEYLDEALQSVLDQIYTNWECIIVNDGSPDNTAAVAQKWVALDNRFKYVYQENGGLSSARNLGLDNAIGDYIQFLDSDDVLDSRKLELSLSVLNAEENSDKKIVISNFRMFTDHAGNSSVPYCKLSSKLFNFERLLYQWDEFFSIPIHCGFFNSSLFERFRFPENLKAKEDWVMWVSLFHSGCKAIFIDKSLALYRRNPNSMTMTKDMQPDYIEAYNYFKTILSEDEFHKLSTILISRYYRSTIYFKKKANGIKKSNTYRFGLLMKKILIKLSILKPFRFLFNKMSQWNMIPK